LGTSKHFGTNRLPLLFINDQNDNMDMSGMSSMEGMGMDSSSDPMFRPYNQVLARGYWYIISGVVGFLLLLRGVEYYQTWSR
jgi:hypothetical protein